LNVWRTAAKEKCLRRTRRQGAEGGCARLWARPASLSRQGRKMTSLQLSPGAAGRCSFIAADFHRLLRAGLPAHLSPES
jgi:hypothetical protein